MSLGSKSFTLFLETSKVSPFSKCPSSHDRVPTSTLTVTVSFFGFVFGFSSFGDGSGSNIAFATGITGSSSGIIGSTVFFIFLGLVFGVKSPP